MTASQHSTLQNHLFPGDGFEAVAFLVCGRRAGKARHILTVKELALVPYEECNRQPDLVTWSTDVIDRVLPELCSRGSALVKIHSHPGGYPAFSETDDFSDSQIFESIFSLIDDGNPHASLVMLPHGKLFGRVFECSDGKSMLAKPMQVMIVGDDVQLFGTHLAGSAEQKHHERTAQAFGSGTIDLLAGCSAAVVGCSGTGSIVIEQLARLGIGHLLLIDPDVVKEKNLNRILNSTMNDAKQGLFKTDVLAGAIHRMGLGTKVTSLPVDLISPQAVRAVAECDFVFGCMDSAEGRHILSQITTFYCSPYWDVGVRLNADGKGGIDTISGVVNYIQPGRSSLLTRELYTLERVRAEGLMRTQPADYDLQVKEGYITGVDVERPAVISVNMFYAALCVNDFLARLHPYRNCENGDYARTEGMLHEFSLCCESETSIEERSRRLGVDQTLAKHVGKGDLTPLLGRPDLS